MDTYDVTMTGKQPPEEDADLWSSTISTSLISSWNWVVERNWYISKSDDSAAVFRHKFEWRISVCKVTICLQNSLWFWYKLPKHWSNVKIFKWKNLSGIWIVYSLTTDSIWPRFVNKFPLVYSLVLKGDKFISET